MDPVRDLGRIEPWQESLERSRARREESRRDSSTRQQRPPEPRAAQNAVPRGTTTDRPRAGRRKAARSRKLLLGAGGIFALAIMVAVLPSALAGRGALTPAGAERPGSPPARPMDGGPLAPGGAMSRAAALNGIVSRVAAPSGSQSCQPVGALSGYVNPLAGAHVTPERIDQGVDYAGSGTLGAIGSATVTYVATTVTGWPGAFIEYRLLDGPDAGCFVYYAEGVTPVAHLHVGQLVLAGQPIANVTPGWSTGIELGWGAGTSTVTYAAKKHQWNADSDQGSVASPAGKSFSALIGALGGPPGKVEG